MKRASNPCFRVAPLTKVLASAASCKRSVRPMAFGFALVLFGVAAVGCKSSTLSRYVSPRITGRIVDAGTQEPIQGVKVWRLNKNANRPPVDPPKGGQWMQQAPPFVMSDRDGQFSLESVRALAPFAHVYWNAGTISLEHPGYRPFSTNYTPAQATNTNKGEPLVDFGAIPLSKKQSKKE
jgi:hypothetical protein